MATSKVKKIETQPTNEVKEEVEKVEKKVELDPHMYVTVKNGYNGVLTYISSKTGEVFTWSKFGDEQEIELIELKACKASSKAFFINNWFLIDDWDVIEWLGVQQYYKNALNADNFDSIFNKSAVELKKTLEKLSAGQKKTVIFRARKLIDDGTIDSIKTIKTLEECLHVELLDRE